MYVIYGTLNVWIFYWLAEMSKNLTLLTSFLNFKSVNNDKIIHISRPPNKLCLYYQIYLIFRKSVF